MSRVLVTGATGFVGKAVLAQLAHRHRPALALVRQPTALSGNGGDIRFCIGDVLDDASLDRALNPADPADRCDAVIHLVGIIREDLRRGITFDRIHHQATAKVVAAARAAGVQRFIHLSALGTRENAASAYHRGKWLGEQAVRGGRMDWTILRPSMIHGPGGEFMRMEARWARRTAPPFLFMPYFGAGALGIKAAHIQPVFVDEVAAALVEALDRPQTIGQTYSLGGADVLTWPEFHRIAARLITGHRRSALPIPAWYAKALLAVLPRKLLPFNRSQVVMALEENTCDNAPFIADFNLQPSSFASRLAEYADQL